MARRITRAVTLWAADRPDQPLAAVLTYTPTDPYAVRLAFMHGTRETASYVFARELLADGLNETAGQGNVTVAPHEHHDWLVITLRQDDAYPFEVYATRDDVMNFTARAYRLVPMGREREWINWDATIATVLGVRGGDVP